MTNHEEFSGLDPTLVEDLAASALLWDVLSMAADARVQNAEQVAKMRHAGRSTAQRIVMSDGPLAGRPLAEQVVPVDSERIVLIPDPAMYAEIAKVIVRLPTDAAYQHDIFFDVVARQAVRQCYLLNEDGLWAYRSAADIEVGPRLQLKQPTSPEPIEVINQLSRYCDHAAFGQQTSFDTDI